MNYKTAEKMYKILANQRRLKILVFLNKSKNSSVKSIAEHINLSIKATSKHLLRMKNVDLVDSKQISLEQYYYISDKNNPFIKHALSIL